MKQKLLGFFLLSFLLIGTAEAQVRRISGKVTSQADGTALSGVTVSAVGTANAAMTDAAGNYVLNAPADVKQIQFRFLGFQPIVVDLTGSATYNVEMTPVATALDAVVVGAAGLETKARTQGTQQTRISSAELTKAKPINLAAGLHAKVPGLQINSISSGVNPTVRLVLRGNRSLLGDNTALLVVDNSIVPSSMLGNINPEDVENVVVLNGAGAAALYGSQGSNGALIVTTKKGRVGTSDIKLSHTTNFEQVSFQPKLQEKFGAGADADLQLYTPYENQQYGPRFDGSMRDVGQTLEDGSIQRLAYAPNSGRYDFWETGVQNQTDFAISSGDERGTSYISLQHLDVSSTTWKDKYNRIGIRVNGTRNAYSNVKVGYNINYIQNRYDQTTTTGDIYNNLLNTPANIPITNYKDWQNDKFSNPNGYYNNYYVNPYFLIDNYRNKTRNDYLTGNMDLTWHPLKWLGFSAMGNISTRNFSNKQTTGVFRYSDYVMENFHGSQAHVAGGVSDGSGFTTTVLGDFKALFNYRFEEQNLGFRFTLGNQIINRYSKNMGVSINGLVIPGLYNVGNRVDPLPNGSESNSTSREVGLYGQLIADYNNYLFFTLSGRNDWVSVLDPENNSFFYPAADISFIASDAIPGLQDNEFINVLKLRAGWSKSGNVNLGAYGLLSTFSQSRGFPYDSGAGFSIDSRMVAAGLRPEITEGVEVGADLTLYRNRIDASITYYNTRTTDQIIPTGVSTATGYESLVQNVGLVTNYGLETSLDLKLLQSADWSWSIGANYTYLQNNVEKISDDQTQVNISTGGSAQVVAAEGKPFPILFGTVYNRDDQGRIIVDRNTGYPSVASSSQFLGNTQPWHRVGLNTYLNYKNFAFSVNAEYRGSYSIYNNAASTYDFSGSSIKTIWYDRDRFVIPNSSYLDPATNTYVANENITVRDGGSGFWANGAPNRNIAENYVYDGSFWKIREITLGYTLPSSLLANTRFVKGAQISVQGRNLFLWTPKSNLYTDPEYNFSDSNAMGITTLGQTPPTRFYGATLTLNF
jgi:TonB-linked SusC/RagA family outer membrane protein